MIEMIAEWGIPGIFIISFLASTLFPLGSEAFVLVALASGSASLPIWVAATLGNTLGAITNYYVGYWGDKFIFSRFIKVSPEKRLKAEQLYAKYGAPILFFSWLPIIGDPLCIVPGVLKLKMNRFIFWVILGKGFRYAMVTWMFNYF
ncbi:DedA family protein [Prolixibacteraceae bacterium JC049]|nr:DedA family protein [Prolixibacteraceae bacterium JC049]